MNDKLLCLKLFIALKEKNSKKKMGIKNEDNKKR